MRIEGTVQMKEGRRIVYELTTNSISVKRLVCYFSKISILNNLFQFLPVT